MSGSVEELQIEINATASKANDALDKLVGKLDRLSNSVGKLNVSNFSGFAVGVKNLSSAMSGLQNITMPDYTRTAKGIEKLASLDAGTITRAANSIGQLGKSLKVLDAVNIGDNAKQFSELATAIAKLGYKSSTQAIQNIPQLATAMKQLMTTLSKAPKVSQNLIDMTNALAKLARTGSSSGKAVNSLTKYMNLFSNSSAKAEKKSISLASAIGKLYASYWALFRVAGKLGDAIDIASDLTEVQNVVNTTFGKYQSLVEDMASTSITDFGMSELTVKQVASRFQAMGTAMGFAQGEMADMSIELTKLTADMASFYNVEKQSDVAEDLESIFTGQTRPLRTYGLDLTEATLKEWALKQGLDADIDSMSQAEKTMLRYQYVMANTANAQGDFARTADTWANQTRILKQNLEQLGSVIGGTLINALKPLVKALNTVISKFIEFAKAVSDSLGKIFGWKYETTGGGITTDLEDASDYADGVSSGLGDAADNAKKLKQQLRGIDELNVITSTDSSGNSGSSSGSSSGSGGSSSSSSGEWTKVDSIFEDYESELDNLYKLGEYIGETLTNTLNNINWDNVYEGARNFGTGLADFLNGLISPELFGAVGRTIANSLNTAIYVALSFGQTFDFHEFGVSIATGINEFFENFDFKSLAKAINVWVDGIGDAIAGFLKTLKWSDILAKAGDFLGELELDTVMVIIGALSIKGVKKIIGANIVKTLVTKAIEKKFADGISIGSLKIDFSKILGGGLLGVGAIGAISSFVDMLTEGFGWIEEAAFLAGLAIAGVGAVILGAPATAALAVAGIIAVVGNLVIAIKENWDEIKTTASQMWEKLKGVFVNGWANIKKEWNDGVESIKKKFSDGWNNIKSTASKMWENLKKVFSDGWKNLKTEAGQKLEDIKKSVSDAWENVKAKTSETWENIKTTTSEKWSNIKDTATQKAEELKNSVSETWENVKSTASETWDNIKTTIQEKWNAIKEWWDKKEELKEITTTIENIKNRVSGAWDTAKNWWNNSKPSLNQITTTVADLKSKLSTAWDKARTWWNNNKPSLSEITAKIKMPHLSVSWNTTSAAAQALQKLGLKGFPNFSVSYYATGGFPEDGWFRANHGEIMGRFDNGKSVVANNMQITQGISDAVYRGNQESNALMREELSMMQRQNELLFAILEKETGISSDDIFQSVRKSADDYKRRTGNPAFSY